MVGTSNLGSWDGQWLWWVKLFFGWLSSPFGLVESPYSSHHNSLMGRAGSGHWPRRHRPYLVPCHSLAVDWFQAQVRMKGRWTGNHGELPFFLPSSMGNSLQIFRSKSLYVYFFSDILQVTQYFFFPESGMQYSEYYTSAAANPGQVVYFI